MASESPPTNRTDIAPERCFLWHAWERWSDPYEQEMSDTYLATGMAINYVITRQKRACTRCGKAQVRKVSP